MRNRLSGYNFQAKTLELNFTFYKSISDRARIKSTEVKPIQRKSIQTNGKTTNESMEGDIQAPFRKSAINSGSPGNAQVSLKVMNCDMREYSTSIISHTMSDNFVPSSVCAHFHIEMSHGDNQEELATVIVPGDSVDSNRSEYIIPDKYFCQRALDIQENEDSSVSGVEVTVFKSGYVAVVIRMVNISPVKGQEILHLIKRPDQLLKAKYTKDLDSIFKNSKYISKKKNKLEAGKLNEIAHFIVSNIEDTISQQIEGAGLEFFYVWEASTSGWTDKLHRNGKEDDPSVSWSRPFVGVIVHEHALGYEEFSAEDVARFLISCGRTTPEFIHEFRDPINYLSSNNRNIYGSGNGIIFWASRGWAVWTPKDQHGILFRINVVEIAHFIGMFLETSLRARRRFNHYLFSEGSEIARDLTQILHQYTKLGSHEYFAKVKEYFYTPASFLFQREINKALGKANSLLSRSYAAAPFDDGANVIEAHLKTHAARSLTKRFKELRNFPETDKAIKDLLAHYVSATNSAAAYMHWRTYRTSVRSLRFTVIGIIIAIIGIFWPMIQKYWES